MPKPKKKPRKRTLFEREHGPIRKATAEELIELEGLEKISGAQSIEIKDANLIWTGGKRSIDVGALFINGLGPHSALEQILTAIIDAHPLKKGTFGKHSDADLKKYRLEQALKLLVGQKPKPGMPKPDYEPVLERVAKRFWDAYRFTKNESATVDQLLWEEARPKNYKQNFDVKRQSNFLKAYRREWKKHKDRLLLKVSASNFPLAALQHRLVRKALASLADLGIPVKRSAR